MNLRLKMIGFVISVCLVRGGDGGDGDGGDGGDGGVVVGDVVDICCLQTLEGSRSQFFASCWVAVTGR